MDGEIFKLPCVSKVFHGNEVFHFNIFYILFIIVDWTGILNREVKERYAVNLLTCKNPKTVYHNQRNPHCQFIFCPFFNETVKVSDYCQSTRVFVLNLWRLCNWPIEIAYWLISLPWWQVTFLKYIPLWGIMFIMTLVEFSREYINLYMFLVYSSKILSKGLSFEVFILYKTHTKKIGYFRGKQTLINLF